MKLYTETRSTKEHGWTGRIYDLFLAGCAFLREIQPNVVFLSNKFCWVNVCIKDEEFLLRKVAISNKSIHR